MAAFLEFWGGVLHRQHPENCPLKKRPESKVSWTRWDFNNLDTVGSNRVGETKGVLGVVGGCFTN